MRLGVPCSALSSAVGGFLRHSSICASLSGVSSDPVDTSDGDGEDGSCEIKYIVEIAVE